MKTILNDEIANTRRRIAQIGQLLFDRRLTDAAGGNISVRVNDVVCMSASYSGSQHQWQIEPENVLIVDMNGKILEGQGRISRESNVHFMLHKTYGEYGTAVIHAHPRNIMVFAAMAQHMPPVLEANLKFGDVECIPYAPAHSVELASNVTGALHGKHNVIQKHAAGVIAPWHGLFLMGKDLDAAFDAVERFDTNAYCILMAQQAFDVNPLLQQKREQLAAARSKFT